MKDRPPEHFLLVADAGRDAVLDPDHVAELDWPAANVTAASNIPAGEELEYHWETSAGANGTHENFTTPPLPVGLTLVELNVTFATTTASDVIGLLAPGTSIIAAPRAYLGVFGEFGLAAEDGSNLTPTASVAVGSHEGHYFDLAFPGGAGPLHLNLTTDLTSSKASGALLIGLKNSAGAVQFANTYRLTINTSRNYTFTLDGSALSEPQLVVAASPGAPSESMTLAAFAAAHPGRNHTATLALNEHAGTLPGFEGAAVVAGAALAAVVAVRRRD